MTIALGVLLKFDWSAVTLILFFYIIICLLLILYYVNIIRIYLLLMDRAQSSPKYVYRSCSLLRARVIIDKYLRIHLTRGTYLVVCMSAA
jgi:hypothetical protein